MDMNDDYKKFILRLSKIDVVAAAFLRLNLINVDKSTQFFVGDSVFDPNNEKQGVNFFRWKVTLKEYKS